MLIKLSRYFMSRANTAKIAQYVDRVTYLGKRNLLFRVDVKHLYSIWNMCKSEEDYRYALTATNIFYNFGRQLSPEAVDKLFITTLRCNQVDEAIELISGSCNWLRKPPSVHLIYILLNDLMSKGDVDRVFKVYKSIRTSWQIPLSSTLYEYCVNFMLTIEDRPLEESLMIYGDSDVMGIKLSEETHCIVLETTLRLGKDNRDMCLSTCTYIINRMFKELGCVTSSKAFYLFSWFGFRFKDELDKVTHGVATHQISDWKKNLEYSLESNIINNKNLLYCKEFKEEMGKELESFKINDKLKY